MPRPPPVTMTTLLTQNIPRSCGRPVATLESSGGRSDCQTRDRSLESARPQRCRGDAVGRPTERGRLSHARGVGAARRLLDGLAVPAENWDDHRGRARRTSRSPRDRPLRAGDHAAKPRNAAAARRARRRRRRRRCRRPSDDSWTRDTAPTSSPTAAAVAGVDWRFNAYGGIYEEYDRDAAWRGASSTLGARRASPRPSSSRAAPCTSTARGPC